MGQLLRLIIIVAVVWLIVRLVKNALARLGGPKSSAAPASPTRKIPAKDVVPCAHCGLHVPETEAIEYRGRFYCSREHLEENDGQ